MLEMYGRSSVSRPTIIGSQNHGPNLKTIIEKQNKGKLG
jgi:hypothetical protein